jgi:uracil-DNA glycosylase
MTNMVILGEAWGSHEAARKAPFVGPSGHMLNDFCEGAGLIPAWVGPALGSRLAQHEHPHQGRHLPRGRYPSH